jgi:hypothetical protein
VGATLPVLLVGWWFSSIRSSSPALVWDNTFRIKNAYVEYQYSLEEVRTGLHARGDDLNNVMPSLSERGLDPATWYRNRHLVHDGQVRIPHAPTHRDVLRNTIQPLDDRVDLQLIAFEGSLLPAEVSSRWHRDKSGVAVLDPATAEQIAAVLTTFERRAGGRSAESQFALLDRHSAASTFISNETAYVDQVSRIQGSGNSYAFDPTVEVAQSGLTVDCTATFADGAQPAVLQLGSRIIQLQKLDTRAERAVNGVPVAYVQVPDKRIHEQQHTLSLPPSSGAIVPIDGRAADDGDAGRFYLFIRRIPATMAPAD